MKYRISDEALAAADTLLTEHGGTLEEAARALGVNPKALDRQLRRWRAKNVRR